MILLLSDLINCDGKHAHIASCRNLKRKDGKPTDTVLPSTGESPRRVDEADDVHGERSIDGIHHRQFSKRLHHEVAEKHS